MIKQLQMGFKLLKYSHGIGVNVVSLLAILILGIWMEWSTLSVPGTDFNALQNMGGCWILIAAMFPLQMLISLNVPNVVAASPWKKSIQTSVFSLSAGVYFLVAFLIVLAIKLVKYSQGVLDYTNLILELLGFPLLVIILLVYMSFSLKYFVVSTIIFLFLMPTLMNIHGLAYYFGWFSVEDASVGMAVAVCLLSILLSVLLSYGILCLIYKKPVSKYSQINSLKKKM